MIPRRKVLILIFSKLSSQPRIYRQIVFLKDSFDVYTAGFDRFESPYVNEHFQIKLPFFRYGLIDKFLWNIPPVSLLLLKLLKLTEHHFDLIIAHDPFTLQAALQLAKRSNARVLHDAHEYTPRQYEDQWIHREILTKIWDYLCRKYMPFADATITVCQGIADEYQRNYDVHCDVITNAPFYSDLIHSSINSKRIMMIHHGVAHPSRRTESMIHLMDLLDERYHLDLILINDGSSYYRYIVNLGKKNPRISFRDPVPMAEIPETINQYDIGLFLLSPETFSYQMALPNKLFEFIQARLAVAVWPSPEMARVVREYDCGVVSEDYSIESMAKVLNALTVEDISRYKNNSHKAASQLCAEKNRDKFLGIVEKIMAEKSGFPHSRE